MTSSNKLFNVFPRFFFGTSCHNKYWSNYPIDILFNFLKFRSYHPFIYFSVINIAWTSVNLWCICLPDFISYYWGTRRIFCGFTWFRGLVLPRIMVPKCEGGICSHSSRPICLSKAKNISIHAFPLDQKICASRYL